MKQTTDIFYPASTPEDTLVRHIWLLRKSDCGIEKEKILPKGTAEIIFNFSENILCFKDPEKPGFKLSRCFINGLNTSPYYLIKNESQAFIGIQLHACALKYLFGMPAKEFTNQVVNGFEVCSSLNDLYEQLLSAKTFNSQVKFILNWFRQKMIFDNKQADKHLLFHLHNNPDTGNLSLKSICKSYNISDRHLRRLSSEYLGINTEDFLLYRKYLKSLFGIHNINNSLTAVAYDSGFYDQAHFIREFKTFTGLTPGKYRKHMSDFPGHLFQSMPKMSV